MENIMVNEFSRLFKEKRLATGKTLRQFCQEHGFDPGNLSKLERGLLPAPTTRDKLENYATALGLQEGTDDWYNFFDLAAAQAGRIPEDVLTKPNVVDKLPVFFRTLRGQKVTEEELDSLVKLIQET